MEPQALQLFVIAAESRVNSNGRPVHFLVKAKSHRDAWQVARQVCKTGKGALIRDTHDQNMLHDFPLAAGTLTVKRVLTTDTSRRGRPPKLTVADLLHLAEDRNIKVPPRVKKVIEELTQD